MSEHNAGAADDPLAAQRALNAFAMGRRVAADDLITELQVEYPPPPQETRVLPGDVAMSATGHIWWIHGHAEISLHATDRRGLCRLLPEVRAMYGELRVLYRSSDHHTGNGPPTHR